MMTSCQLRLQTVAENVPDDPCNTLAIAPGPSEPLVEEAR
jgi:hypothetical protein